MKVLLYKMEKYFGKGIFKSTKNKMYLKYKNGFYVNNKLEDDGCKFNSIEELIRYVTRYCSRPVIAESRILNYDGEFVTWWYSDHTNEKYLEVKESTLSFISKIIRHLLPEKFKIIRYYGFYKKKHSFHDKMIMMISNEKKKIRKQF